jgi:hypothetical protein
MLYSYLANLVILVHFGFILLVIFGGILVYYRKKLIWLHLPALVWGICIEFFGWVCPLTPLENKFRYISIQAGYEGGFIEHYFMPIIYPEGLTRNIQIMFGAFVLVLNLIVYSVLFTRWKKNVQR